MPSTHTHGMTARQERFAEQYLIHGDVRKAAVLAGYAEASARITGQKLLDHSGVRGYLERAKAAKLAKPNAPTKQWIIDKYVEVVNLGMERGQLAPVNVALEKIGRECFGMFLDRREITVNYNAMSVDELAGKLADAMQRLGDGVIDAEYEVIEDQSGGDDSDSDYDQDATDDGD